MLEQETQPLLLHFITPPHSLLFDEEEEEDDDDEADKSSAEKEDDDDEADKSSVEKEDDDDEADKSSKSSADSDSVSEQLPRSKSGLQRCKTAPAMDMAAVLRELQSKLTPPPPPPAAASELDEEDEHHIPLPSTQIRQAALLLLLYLTIGVIVYSLNTHHFSGSQTHPVIDALYFCIVTMCTIGYGDITPLSPLTKLFSCFFVLVGFGFIDILLSAVVNHVLDLQERHILSALPTHSLPPALYTNPSSSSSSSPKTTTWFFLDVAKGRMRIRLKVAFALSVLVFCIGLGALVLSFLEDLSWVDSLYLSALSVTTVGYGDKAFTTLSGRLFAAFWLLFSTLAVARSFLYLVEARIDKRQRSLAKWVLQRDITPQDLLAANINNNDFITKSEYVIYKLKEMGKIGELDISLICNQFQKLDPNNLGRITIPDLLQNR